MKISLTPAWSGAEGGRRARKTRCAVERERDAEGGMAKKFRPKMSKVKFTTALHGSAFGYFIDDDIRFFDKGAGRAFDCVDDRFLQSVDALCKRSAR